LGEEHIYDEEDIYDDSDNDRDDGEFSDHQEDEIVYPEEGSSFLRSQL
jgi:hypothetical protein